MNTRIPDVVLSTTTEEQPIPLAHLDRNWETATLGAAWSPTTRDYVMRIYRTGEKSDASAEAARHMRSLGWDQVEMRVEKLKWTSATEYGERILVGRLTGDRSETAEFYVLKVTDDLNTLVTRLHAHVELLDNLEDGLHDITHRGSRVEMVTLKGIPEGEDIPEEIRMLEGISEWTWLHPNVDPYLLFESDQVCRTELHGIQVWAQSARVTCYDRGDGSYRIESADSITKAFYAYQD